MAITPEQIADLMTKADAVYDTKVVKDNANSTHVSATSARDSAKQAWTTAVNNGQPANELEPLAVALVNAEVEVVEAQAALSEASTPHTQANDALAAAIAEVVQSQLPVP